ncbi:MAG TPA: hypothetical protein VGD19_01930 [Allosphingosinicella sp.]|jgi:hypothetical protein
MTSEQELARFMRSTFGSVWTLELLLHLRQHGGRAWSRAELVQALRASDSIISNGTSSLLAAGLIVIEDDGAARYRPAAADLEALVAGAATLYAQRPDAVRRVIVDPAAGGVTAFADAFRLRRD